MEKLEENAEVTMSGNNTQHNEGGEDKDDAEEEEAGVYIPGANLLAKPRFESLTILIKKFTLFSLQVFC